MANEDRLRPHPATRFAGDIHVVDLDDAFARLPGESVERRGLSQEALYKHGRLTTAAFAMRKGARLEDHAVDGEAVLHVLAGEVHLTMDGVGQDVAAGQIVLLAPGVEHAVEATEDARLLMHIVLERA
ncbi:MAG: cupin domain-containing protein [Phycisphaerales bacterium JB060]